MQAGARLVLADAEWLSVCRAVRPRQVECDIVASADGSKKAMRATGGCEDRD